MRNLLNLLCHLYKFLTHASTLIAMYCKMWKDSICVLHFADTVFTFTFTFGYDYWYLGGRFSRSLTKVEIEIYSPIITEILICHSSCPATLELISLLFSNTLLFESGATFIPNFAALTIVFELNVLSNAPVLTSMPLEVAFVMVLP